MDYFTVNEVDKLIPELERVLGPVPDLEARIQDRHQRLGELERSKAPPAEVALARGRLDFLVASLKGQLAKVEALGGRPKGLDPLLVDFPSRLNGRDIFLCWKLGEKRVAFYHGLEEGYSGRKELPRRVWT